jgi:hypothetical protein
MSDVIRQLELQLNEYQADIHILGSELKSIERARPATRLRGGMRSFGVCLGLALD